MHHGRPFALAFVMPELDVGDFGLTEFRLEPVLAQIALRETDRVLPVPEVVDPVVEVEEFANHQRFLMSWRAWGVENSASWSAFSTSSISSGVLCSERYSAAFVWRPANGAIDAHRFARASVSGARDSGETTRSKRPSCAASAAGTMRALHTSSSAFEILVRRGRK